jgi:hypothetical protein
MIFKIWTNYLSENGLCLAVTLLTRILEVLGSNLGWVIGYHD